MAGAQARPCKILSVLLAFGLRNSRTRFSVVPLGVHPLTDFVPSDKSLGDCHGVPPGRLQHVAEYSWDRR